MSIKKIMVKTMTEHATPCGVAGNSDFNGLER